MATKKILPYEKLKDLKQIFETLDVDKKTLGLSLLDEAMFCGETLKKLKEDIENDGTVVDMCQGNYSIKRANPALNSYNQLVKNYQSLIKQMKDLLSSEEIAKESDPLLDFIGSK